MDSSIKNMDTYLVGSAVLLSIFGISHYMGYLTGLTTWVDTRRQKVKLLLTLIDTLQNPSSSSASTTRTAFNVNDTDTSANITYERMGHEYILFVPYNRGFVAPMSQFKAELLRKNANPVNITQQPGIPYMVTADELGGYAIRMTNQETGVAHEYNHKTAPMFGEEVMDRE